MYKRLSQFAFVLLVLVLAGGPVLAAASIAVPASPSIGAPAPTDSADVLGALAGAALAFGMALKVKDTGAIAKKFVRNAQQAAPDYAEGVKSAGGDWEAGARAGAENYKAAVVEAAGRGAFEKGIAAAGASKYVANASSKGAQRFGPGVAQAEGDYARGAQPYLDVLKGITLPGRRPKGDPSNMERANVIARALRAKKVGS